jgi:chromosome segregation ATPase
MEVSPLTTPGAEGGTEQFAAALHTQRQRVREFLLAQQERLRRAENELSEQLRHIAEELAAERRQTRQSREELDQRSAQLKQQADAIELLKVDLAAKQAEWEKLYRGAVAQQQSIAEQLKRQQEEFARRQGEIKRQQSDAAAVEAELKRERKELEAGRGELEKRLAENDALRNSLQTRQVELDAINDSQQKRQAELDALLDSQQMRRAELERRQQELSARTADCESRRRDIARKLKAQRSANLKELELKRVEIERQSASDRHELQRQIESLQEECRTLREKSSALDNSVDRREVERIEAEKKGLVGRLAELEGQLDQARQELADARAAGGKDKENTDDLRRRCEMAIEELRELKARNEELQEQLASARRDGGENTSRISSGVLNWEAEKQRILAALEADFEEDHEEDREEKMKAKEVIRRTDRLITEKNREIGELRQLLESQTGNIGSMAVGAAALGQILDTDAVIQEERKNLAQLQEECRDKLRHAEIEISLERAKIARERVQLDEKLRALEQKGLNSTTNSEEKKPAKPVRGRWLAHLGLTGFENGQEDNT